MDVPRVQTGIASLLVNDRDKRDPESEVLILAAMIETGPKRGTAVSGAIVPAAAPCRALGAVRGRDGIDFGRSLGEVK